MDELNVIYFAPKWWLYVMVWLPRTTDNSTYFTQSLEIQGIESRLYLDFGPSYFPTACKCDVAVTTETSETTRYPST